MILNHRNLLTKLFFSFLFFMAVGQAHGQDKMAKEKQGRAGLLKNCPDSNAIQKIITDAIALGAPIYNSGMHIGCYRVYEWAAYKIIHVYGNSCSEAGKVLTAAVDKTHGEYSDIEKAWLMRAAFDKILGEPTTLEKQPAADEEKKRLILKG